MARSSIHVHGSRSAQVMQAPLLSLTLLSRGCKPSRRYRSHLVTIRHLASLAIIGTVMQLPSRRAGGIHRLTGRSADEHSPTHVGCTCYDGAVAAWGGLGAINR